MKLLTSLAGPPPIFATLVLCACASSASQPGADGGRPPWPPGTYDILASVTYRMDSETGTRTERLEHRAELLVAPDESLTFSSSSGLCHRQAPDELRRDIARGVRSFSCQDASYVFRPTGGTVGGSAFLSVQEGIRTKGPCEEWTELAGGGRACARYTWYVDYRVTRKQATLRIMRR